MFKTSGDQAVWKFNSTLINDQEYWDLLRLEYKNWLEDFTEVSDKRVLLDLIKYKYDSEQLSIAKQRLAKKEKK